MEQDYGASIISLIDDEGQEHEFEILDELDNDDGHFMALIPTEQDPEEAAGDAETYFIMEVITDEEGEEILQEVEDDEVFNRLADVFEERFNEMYFED